MVHITKNKLSAPRQASPIISSALLIKMLFPIKIGSLPIENKIIQVKYLVTGRSKKSSKKTNALLIGKRKDIITICL